MFKDETTNEENKCEKLKMKHAWYDTTPNVIYPTYPPQYPCRQETCHNCGLIRYHREKTERWIEYSDGKERNYEWGDGSITIIGNDLTTGTGGTVNIKSNE